MKKVLVLTGKKVWSGVPFSKDSYRLSYEILYSLAEKNGIKMYRSPYQEYNQAKKCFSRAWTFDTKKKRWIVAKNIVPDLIFDKTPANSETYCKKEMIEKSYPFFNHPEFTKLARNKLVTGILFGEWSKTSWLITNRTELKSILPKIKTGKVVLKPLAGSGGEKIYILNKKDALGKVAISESYIAQEFIDSSAGVPGVSAKMHDLRLVLVNDKIIYSYIREPKTGSFLANCSQGGTLRIVPLAKIPKSVFPIIDRANKLFKTFQPRIFSIDIMFDEKRKPWVVELNAMPGLNLCADEERPYILKLYRELIRTFLRLTQP